MQQATTSVASGKIFPAKTNWSMHAKHQFVHPKSIHMFHLSCHSTCPLPQRILLSKRQSRLYESLPQLPAGGGDSRQRNEFVDFGVQTRRKSRFFMKFRHLTRATGVPCETLSSFKLFVYFMNRVETLHTARYNINDRRKNSLGQNDSVELCETSK